MITIHCGLHKTGSSSIQLALKSVPQLAPKIDVPQEGQGQTTADFRTRLELLHDSSVKIFSDEGVLGHPHNGYSTAAERLRVLQDVVANRPAMVVVYFRQTTDWITSVYLQEIQEGGSVSPEDFWARLQKSELLHWDKFLQMLDDYIPPSKLMVRLYEPGRDVVEDFFSVAQLGKTPYVRGGGYRDNRSIAAIHAPILRALNSQSASSKEQLVARRRFFQQVLVEGAPRGGSPFPEAIQREMNEQYGISWNRLTDSMLRRDLTEGHRFRDVATSFSFPPRPYVGLDLNGAPVQNELLRSLDLLSQRWSIQPQSIWTRASMLLASDPSALVPIARQKLLGLIGRRP